MEYRLAPEHPLPSAVDDATALYKSLIKDKCSPSKIIIMGDSAGGGLSLLIIQNLISNKLPIPRGVVVLSPWTDLSSSGQSYIRNRLSDVLLRHESLKWGVKQILGHNHQQRYLNDSLFSPLFGSFKGFPSMYITVGTSEILEDDSQELVDKVKHYQKLMLF